MDSETSAGNYWYWIGCAMHGRMIVLVAHVETDGNWVFETR